MINKYNTKQKILKQSSIDNTHKIKLNKGITSFALYDTNFIIENNLNYWYSDNYILNIDFSADTNKIYKLVTTDSIKTLDTLNVSFEKSTKKFMNINSETALKPNEDIILSISNSLENIDTTKIPNHIR